MISRGRPPRRQRQRRPKCSLEPANSGARSSRLSITADPSDPGQDAGIPGRHEGGAQRVGLGQPLGHPDSRQAPGLDLAYHQHATGDAPERAGPKLLPPPMLAEEEQGEEHIEQDKPPKASAKPAPQHDHAPPDSTSSLGLDRACTAAVPQRAGLLIVLLGCAAPAWQSEKHTQCGRPPT